MKKRILISEEEKNRILGLHKKLMVEQPDADVYAPIQTDKKGFKKGFISPNLPTYKDGVHYFTDTQGVTDQSYATNWDEIQQELDKLKIHNEEHSFDDYESEIFKTIEDNLKKLGQTDPLSSTPQIIIIKDGKIIYSKAKPNPTEVIEQSKTNFKPVGGEDVVVDPKVKYNCVTEHPYVSKQTPNNQATRYIWGNLFFTLDGKYFRGGNEGDKFDYFCEGKIIKTGKDGNIKPSMNQSVTPDGVKVVTDFDKKYNYKKEGDKYYFQLKSKPESWTEAKDSAKIAIGYQVFKDKSVCKFPAGDACPDYNGEKWNENPEKDKVDFDKTQIGFCSTKYCTVKYIQNGLNYIIKTDTSLGHSKLKGMTPLTKDGKFGTTTQTYIYKLLGKVAATTKEIEKEWQTK